MHPDRRRGEDGKPWVGTGSFGQWKHGDNTRVWKEQQKKARSVGSGEGGTGSASFGEILFGIIAIIVFLGWLTSAHNSNSSSSGETSTQAQPDSVSVSSDTDPSPQSGQMVLTPSPRWPHLTHWRAPSGQPTPNNAQSVRTAQ